MDNREAVIIETVARIKVARVALGLAMLKRSPDTAVGLEHLPAVFIHESDDDVVSASNASWHGFPKKRRLQLIVEVWHTSRSDVRTLFKAVRALIYQDKFSTSTRVQELKAFGPYNNGIPGMMGMQLIMALDYVDLGPDQ